MCHTWANIHENLYRFLTFSLDLSHLYLTADIGNTLPENQCAGMNWNERVGSVNVPMLEVQAGAGLSVGGVGKEEFAIIGCIVCNIEA